MVPNGEGDRLQGGELEAAISTAVVQALHQFTGRGPVRARTTLGNDLVVCVMRSALTKGEQSLVDHGRGAVVLRTREAYQELMEAAAVASVEALTGRTVSVFMSCNHLDPDVAAEVFVLQPA